MNDDAVLLLVRTRMLDENQVATWELTAEAAMVGKARAVTTGQLGTWGLDELSFSTELIVSELVTNAIRYAVSPIHVRLIRDETLTCEVADTGHTSPHLRHAAADDESGRGLYIVAQMAQQWGTRYTPTGKTIWVEQALPQTLPSVKLPLSLLFAVCPGNSSDPCPALAPDQRFGREAAVSP